MRTRFALLLPLALAACGGQPPADGTAGEATPSEGASTNGGSAAITPGSSSWRIHWSPSRTQELGGWETSTPRGPCHQSCQHHSSRYHTSSCLRR